MPVHVWDQIVEEFSTPSLPLQQHKRGSVSLEHAFGASAPGAPMDLAPPSTDSGSDCDPIWRRSEVGSASGPSTSDTPASPRSSTSLVSDVPFPTSKNDCLTYADSLSLQLVFGSHDVIHAGTSTSNASESSNPPAFFPGQRISFLPRLRVTHKNGLPIDSSCAYPPCSSTTVDEDDDVLRLSGMMLSVTGVVETLHSQSGKTIVKSSRLIADFCMDLSKGIQIWQKDAQAVQKQRGGNDGAASTARLLPGTYVLPLSMTIPASDKLPPSFEAVHFRLRYTITLALFGTSTRSSTTDDKPRILKLVHCPFQILPATLPSIAPTLPVLIHTPPQSVNATSILSSFARLVGGSSDSRKNKDTKPEWRVRTSLPTASYSPFEVIPITLHITAPSILPSNCTSNIQQIFVRLTLLQRMFVRESSVSVQEEGQWGLEMGGPTPPFAVMAKYAKETTELTSTWGLITLPASGSAVCLDSLALPLSAVLGQQSGHSTCLDLVPGAGRPTLVHGESSWFSPALLETLRHSKAVDKHLHISSRFYVCVEVGFFASPPSSSQTRLGVFAPQSGPCPFSSRNSVSSGKVAFPGKLRDLEIPITIGSVAEPLMSCMSDCDASNGEEGSSQGEIEEFATLDGPQTDVWLVAPPAYDDALKEAPGYAF